MGKNDSDLANVNDLAIDSLTDAELDSVAGGQDVAATTSCSCCAAGATVQTKSPSLSTSTIDA